MSWIITAWNLLRFIISRFIPFIHGFRSFVIDAISNHILIIRSTQQQVGSVKFKNEGNTDSMLSSQRAVEYYLHWIQAPRVIITAAHWLWYHPILLISARRGISCRNTFAFPQRTAGVQCPVPLSSVSISVWILIFCGFNHHCQWTGGDDHSLKSFGKFIPRIFRYWWMRFAVNCARFEHISNNESALYCVSLCAVHSNRFDPWKSTVIELSLSTLQHMISDLVHIISMKQKYHFRCDQCDRVHIYCESDCAIDCGWFIQIGIRVKESIIGFADPWPLLRISSKALGHRRILLEFQQKSWPGVFPQNTYHFCGTVFHLKISWSVVYSSFLILFMWCHWIVCP